MRSKEQQIAFNNGFNKARWPDDRNFNVKSPSRPDLAEQFAAGVDAGRAEWGSVLPD
jgi:hypothetical protein